MANKQSETVKSIFDDLWNDYKKGYRELVAKFENNSYVVRGQKTISQVNRALISDQYIMNHYGKDSRIIEAACGNGFNTVFMAKKGYEIIGFDVSDSAIRDAKKLAVDEGVPDNIFSSSDHSFFKSVETSSVDCVIALGLMRYLEPMDNDTIYREVSRILKPGGCFLVTNDNILSEIFAMNDGSLDFWSNQISDYSDVEALFEDRSLLDVMSKHYKLPQRKFSANSASKHIKRLSKNPLTFANEVAQYDLRLDKIYYPDTHLLPPLLESMVDQEALDDLKAKVALDRSEGDWRAMFMGFEFLTCLVHNDDG